MAGEPIITVVGNLTADPELRFIPSGKAVASFTVASTPRKKVGDSWEDGETLWLRCSAWDQMAENVSESLEKGARVIVTGRLSTRSYETREGEQRSSLELQVDEVGPSLRRATAKVTRAATRENARNGNQPAAGGDPWASPAASDPWASQPQSEEPPF